MNKTLLIGLAVGAVVIIAAAGVFLLNSKKQQPATTSETPETSVTNTDTQPRSLRELMSFANNQTCTFTDDQGNSGVVYVSDNKMRGDFQSSLNGENTESHMLINGNDMYLWFADNPEGFKTSLESVKDLQAEQGDDEPKTVDIDKQVDYECQNWTVDQSVFQVPTDVKFTDYSAMMESAAEMMEDSPESLDGNAAQCQACESLPDSAKAQCLATLKCN